MINEEHNAAEACTSLASETITAEYIWEAAREFGFPVAIWRLPETRRLKLIVSERAVPSMVNPDLEKLPPGFLMAPFDADSDSKVFFLEGNLILTFPLGESRITIQEVRETNASEFSERLLDKALEIQRGRLIVSLAENRLTPISGDGARERFQRIVQLGAESVKAGHLFKVVLSRTREFEINTDFSLTSAFLQLESAYPTAFVSMASLPHREEVWLGASPEILVEVKARRCFRTVALAGTQSAKDSEGVVKPKFRVLWNEKEIEEQAIVSRYIIECFKRIRLREYVETGPRSSKAGNLYHLKSDFEVDLESVNFSELGTVMLKLLHPTSAVCGMPKESAMTLLHSLEGYQRSFYSGYWGPVNVDNDSNLFVNLRTLSIKGNVMTLYAGAGITADSDPEAEWNETELKCDTLLSVIDPNVSFVR